MQKWNEDVTDLAGNALAGVTITVTLAGTNTPAALFSDNGTTPITGTLVTDNTGSYSFYAANGKYDVTASKVGVPGKTQTILLYDPADATTGADLTALTARVATDEGLIATNTAAIATNASAIATKASLIQLAANTGTPGATLIGYIPGDTVGSAVDKLKLRHVADYTALRALTADVKSVYVTGYLVSTAPSNIAGEFTRDDSDTTTADNGATVIVDAANRRWKRCFVGNVKAEWFGASTSNSDNLVAIQAALTWRGANGGGLVELGVGTFNVSAALSMPAKTTLVGQGKKSTTLQFSHTGDGVTSIWPINSSTAANVGVRSLGLTNTNGANAGGGFVDVGGTFVDLYDVRSSGWKHGIIFDQTEIATIDLCDINQPAFAISGVWLVNGADHTAGASALYTNRITVSRTQFNCAAGAQYNILDDGGGNHTFRDNNFNAGAYGIRVAGVFGLAILDNESEVHTGGDIWFAKTSAAGGAVGRCVGFRVTGNELISVGGSNISIDDAANGSITDNVFGQATSAAINFTNGATNDATNILIQQNSKLISGPGITATPFVGGFSRNLRNNQIRQTPVTYIAATTAAGTATITPATMEFINVGTRLHIVNPDGTNGEDTIVTAKTSTTFTCVLASSKAANAQVLGITPGDQEEGTWTPTLGATTTNGTHTYSVQSGQYSRRGNLVHLRGSMSVSAKDIAISGTLQIKGVPLVSENVSNGNAFANIALYGGFTLAGGSYTHLSGVILPNSSTIDLRKSGSGLALATVPATDLPGSTVDLYFEVTYTTSAL